MDRAEHDMMTGGHGHAAAVNGVSASGAGYLLSPVAAPSTPADDGALEFHVLTPSGAPLTAYTPVHGKELHLVVVRSDGASFRHVHPHLDAATGVWSLPWQWEAAGTYRVYADFTPAHDGAPGLVLSRTVDVAGRFEPTRPEPVRTADVGGFTVTLRGDLLVGDTSTLRAEVRRDGRAVTTLQPYLGAFGHLVALRQGDLAYLHIHPHGDEPAPDQTGGPDIAFMASAPSAGRYLLYLDFQVDGRVHTAAFAVDATRTH